MSNIDKAERFLKDIFIENPVYSFGDWTIMYNHSRNVRDFALKIAEFIECDKRLLEIESILHDIGKAYKTDVKTLRERHSELGYEVAKNLLTQLESSQEQQEKLTAFLAGDTDSIEGRIIKDADTVAFFADKKLQAALKNWADEQGLSDELQRKVDKFKSLIFESSRAIAGPLYEQMKKRWNLS